MTQQVSIEAVKLYYHRERPEGHWFDKATMSWFNTRLPRLAWRGDTYGTDYYFVTGERMDHRFEYRFSVRCLDAKTGDISTVGEFRGYADRRTANTVARHLAVD